MNQTREQRMTLTKKYPYKKFVRKFMPKDEVHQAGDDRCQGEVAYNAFLKYVKRFDKDKVMEIFENKISMSTHFDADDCRSLAEAIYEDFEELVSISI